MIRNGHRKDGTQRFLCKECGKAFTVKSNSITAGTHKSLEVWENYVECMMLGLTIRKTAELCGIHKNTAFLWRHKILDALQTLTKSAKLDGIIEADETFFDTSYKGNHTHSKTFKMPRKARKRGHSVHTRGISREKVCVPCAVSRKGDSFAKVSNLGRVTSDLLNKVFEGKIDDGSILVTDAHSAYVNFAYKNNLHEICT